MDDKVFFSIIIIISNDIFELYHNDINLNLDWSLLFIKIWTFKVWELQLSLVMIFYLNFFIFIKVFLNLSWNCNAKHEESFYNHYLDMLEKYMI